MLPNGDAVHLEVGGQQQKRFDVNGIVLQVAQGEFETRLGGASLEFSRYNGNLSQVISETIGTNEETAACEAALINMGLRIDGARRFWIDCHQGEFKPGQKEALEAALLKVKPYFKPVGGPLAWAFVFRHEHDVLFERLPKEEHIPKGKAGIYPDDVFLEVWPMGPTRVPACTDCE